MVKINVNCEKKGKSNIAVKGYALDVITELGYAVYRILEELDMGDEPISERIDTFHGAMLFHAVGDYGPGVLTK